MRKRIVAKAEQRVIRYVRSRLQEIDVQRFGIGLHNFRCHDNAMNLIDVHDDAELELCEVMIVDENAPALHYIVRTKDGDYLDPTLGWKVKQTEYYLIRTIPKYAHKSIYSEFERSLKQWCSDFVWAPWRWIFGITRIT